MYKGNYDTFEKTREEQLKNQQKAFEANERSRAHMQVLSLALFLAINLSALLGFTIEVVLFALIHSSSCAPALSSK